MEKFQRLLFVSNNVHKLEEVRPFLPSSIHLIGLKDIGWTQEISEPYHTFEENAAAKVNFVFQHTGIPCFADDSGLEVEALDGRPGVLSARYGGEQKSQDDHIKKVLNELSDSTNRAARFVTVIAFQPNARDIHYFSGVVQGTISPHPIGAGGFGYDPIFIPSGFDQTFAQLPASVKQRISHRAKAMQRFIQFIR